MKRVEAANHPDEPGSSRLWAAGSLWIACYAGSLVALKNLPLGTGAAVAAGLIPVLPFFLFVQQYVSHLRSADELQRRIQLEALAFAFRSALAGLMVLGLLQLASPLNPQDYRHVWGFFPAVYFLSVWIASRRYR